MKLPVVAVALTAWAALAPSALAQAPLDRRVSVHARDVSLRDALDRVAAAGSFKLSYSGDNLPLDRRVTVWRDTSRVGDVLGELLRPFAVTAVPMPDDQVVLTPRAPDVRDSVSTSVAMLDRVVVTGSVVGASERPLPVALDVVRGRDIERRSQNNLSSVFDGSVPGVWMWEQSPTTMLARYASIRGASSFGASYPKVYIDGVEVANPLLLTQLTPERVERVEVIRGPQGAALYGSDAISGVVNIISRTDPTSADGSHMMLRSEGGVASGFGANASAVQSHTLSAQLGSNLRSASGSVGIATSGAYIPDAYSHEFRASGAARVVGTMSTLTATAHYFGKNAVAPRSPLLLAQDSLSGATIDTAQKLRMYTIGSTITVSPSDRWTYAITGGVDGYAIGHVSSELTPIPAEVDQTLRDASGSAMRATMRASAVATAGSPDRVGATFTFAGEHSTLRDRSLQEAPWSERNRGPGSGGSVIDSLGYVTEWSSNMGLTSQVDLALLNTMYMTAGVREERIGQQLGVTQTRALPMFGAALVRDFGGVTAKMRVAYGRGIRALNSSERVHAAEGTHWLTNPFLSPEEQSGIEGGVDILFGARFGFHVTRFDQLAYNLIQTVMLVDSSILSSRSSYWQQLQNVGRISNRGWEAQASGSIGALALVGALSTVDSRVQQNAVRYSGDMRPGDRMLGVPARTLSGTAAWSHRGMQFSATLARASDWINYDRLAIGRCVRAQEASGTCADAASLNDGATLRKYWAHYDGNTRLRAESSFGLIRGVSLTLTGENLLNYQRGEPDTYTIVPGRTITAGVRARF